MPFKPLDAVSKLNPHHSVMAVGAATLAVFAIVIIASNAFFALRDRGQMPLRDAAAQTHSIAQVIAHHVQSDADVYAAGRSFLGAFESDGAIAWANIVPIDSYQQYGAMEEIVAESGATPESVFRLLNAMRAAPNQVAVVNSNGHILTARSIAADRAVLIVYDRARLSAMIIAPPIARWVVGLLTLALASISLLAAVHFLIQRPITQLSQAIAEAETTRILTLDPALPNNELGQLATRIATWLERLNSAQAELRRMALIVDRTDNAALILTRSLKIQWANQAFETLCGYSISEMEGRTLGSLMMRGDVNKDASMRFRQALRVGEAHTEEILILCKDGSNRWIVAELQPVHNDDGRVVGWTGINTDITEQKATAEELAARVDELERLRLEQAELTKQLQDAKQHAEAVNQSKSDFLANMSHEIRTPMNGVLGMADVLMSSELTEDQQSYVETIQESGKALLAIINEILDLSKLEAGKIELDERQIDIRQITDAVVRLLSPRAVEKGLTLDCTVSDDVPVQHIGDDGRLRQILTNLVGNAVKFTGKGHIDIRVTKADAVGIRVEVEDTGHGIAAHVQERIFQRYKQGAAGEADRPGTGLGLSISQELVLLMGGRIGVTSQENVGSTFWFEVPLATSENVGETTTMQSDSEPQENAQPLCILLVEDHPVNQSLMKAFVSKLGHQLEIADDGVDAVKVVRDRTFDLILMDIQMPRMDGVMTTKVIRSLETDAANVPIIAVTAHAMAGQREHYLSAGMNGYVSKPVQLVTLQEEIERVMATVEADAADTEVEAEQTTVAEKRAS